MWSHFGTQRSGGDTLYLYTKLEGAALACSRRKPNRLAREQLAEVIPETKIKLESVTPAGGKLVAVYTKNASSEAKVFDASGRMKTFAAFRP